MKLETIVLAPKETRPLSLAGNFLAVDEFEWPVSIGFDNRQEMFLARVGLLLGPRPFSTLKIHNHNVVNYCQVKIWISAVPFVMPAPIQPKLFPYGQNVGLAAAGVANYLGVLGGGTDQNNVGGGSLLDIFDTNFRLRRHEIIIGNESATDDLNYAVRTGNSPTLGFVKCGLIPPKVSLRLLGDYSVRVENNSAVNIAYSVLETFLAP